MTTAIFFQTIQKKSLRVGGLILKTALSYHRSVPILSSFANVCLAGVVVIKQGLKTFVEVGQALMLIRDKRLYRVEYGTFEAYCNAKWNLQRHYVNRMISASEVVGNLVPHGTKPQTEYQARPLTKLEPELQAEAWQQVVEQHGAQFRISQTKTMVVLFGSVT